MAREMNLVERIVCGGMEILLDIVACEADADELESAEEIKSSGIRPAVKPEYAVLSSASYEEPQLPVEKDLIRQNLYK